MCGSTAVYGGVRRCGMAVYCVVGRCMGVYCAVGMCSVRYGGIICGRAVYGGVLFGRAVYCLVGRYYMW